MKKSTKEVKLTNVKGQYDKYLVLAATTEELAAAIRDEKALKTINKLIHNAAFYVRHGKPLHDMTPEQSSKAIEATKAKLAEVAEGLRRTGTIERKAPRFYDYSTEQVGKMSIEDLRKYGKCLSSYLTNNGWDEKYQQYYDAYSAARLALTPVHGAVSKKDVKDILDKKLTKAALIEALTELISK